jgi:hypothetical protein
MLRFLKNHLREYGSSIHTHTVPQFYNRMTWLFTDAFGWADTEIVVSWRRAYFDYLRAVSFAFLLRSSVPDLRPENRQLVPLALAATLIACTIPTLCFL